MENLEKVELVREKCNVSYEEAREVLEECGYEVLDAIIMLERAVNEAKVAGPAIDAEPEVEPEVEAAVADEVEEPSTRAEAHGESKASRTWKSFCAQCKEIARSGMETTFVAERYGERVVAIPVLFVVLGLVFWGATLWLMIIGLFFGFRYRVEGKGDLVNDLNGAMGKAADVAEDIKGSVA